VKSVEDMSEGLVSASYFPTVVCIRTLLLTLC